MQKCRGEIKKKKIQLNNNVTHLSLSFNKQGSNGKNMSSLSIPPKALERSASNKSSKTNNSADMKSRAAFACLRNSSTTLGKHTCQKKLYQA
jgi:hypothetical protein